MLDTIIAITLGYLLGSLPSAYLIGRLVKGIDIRQVGSKNMGAMNVIYEVGVIWGILVLLLDALKGVVAVLLACSLGMSVASQLTGGFAAVAGHTFPIFLKFRGGKGGATTLGLLLFLMPRSFICCLAIVTLGVLITRNLTFSYSILFLFFPFAGWLIYHSVMLVVFSSALALWIVVSNIPGLRKIKREGLRQSILRRSLKDRRV